MILLKMFEKFSAMQFKPKPNYLYYIVNIKL